MWISIVDIKTYYKREKISLSTMKDKREQTESKKRV